MDIVELCKKFIHEKLEEIDSHPQPMQGEGLMVSPATEKDKNLDKILNQQAHLKRIIDQDNHIQMLKSSITKVSIDVEDLRKQCTKINEDALRSRQEVVEQHAIDIDKFQMAQMRSIADDYNRNQQILELRKREIQSLKREIEREEKERENYLADIEKKLEKKVQEREKALRGGSLPFMSTLSDVNDELNNPNHIELISVDEYAPYGAAPHSRIRGRGSTAAAAAAAAAAATTTGGRGRGRRKRG